MTTDVDTLFAALNRPRSRALGQTTKLAAIALASDAVLVCHSHRAAMQIRQEHGPRVVNLAELEMLRGSDAGVILDNGATTALVHELAAARASLATLRERLAACEGACTALNAEVEHERGQKEGRLAHFLAYSEQKEREVTTLKEQRDAALARAQAAEGEVARLTGPAMTEWARDAHAAMQREDALRASLAAAEGALGATSRLRPEVLRFAEAMEERLRANEHKGGWHDDFAADLMRRLNEEADELHEALQKWGVAPSADRPAARLSVLLEAADVGNFAMMVADVTGGLAALPAPGRGADAAPPADTFWMVERVIDGVHHWLRWTSGERRTWTPAWDEATHYAWWLEPSRLARWLATEDGVPTTCTEHGVMGAPGRGEPKETT